MTQLNTILAHPMIMALIEPQRLLVIWQAPVSGYDQPVGKRFVVGEIIKAGSTVQLRYFHNETVQEAIEKGFIGLTAYPYDPQHPNKSFEGNIISVLSQRLPPSSRTDYGEYLKSYMISPDATGISVLSLLAYTGGRLAGDGFSFCHTFEDIIPPFDFTFEIAGVRYNSNMEPQQIQSLIHKPLSFDDESDNSYDTEAIAVKCDGQLLGYVPKGLNYTIKRLRAQYRVQAIITKVNGTPIRPNILVYVIVSNRHNA